MAIASSTAMLIAAGISAAGALKEGQAAKASADFQARINDQQAEREKLIAASEESDFRREQSRNFAERRAAMGKGGVSIGEGSPLLAADDFAAEAELNAQRIRSGGDVRSTRLRQEAELARMAGKSAQQRGVMRAGSSLLSGFAKFN